MINLSVALASAVSCYGNLVKHTSTVSLSKDKWVLTGGDDHLSLRKLWIPFVWRVALISGSISAAPLVSELADYWGTKESVLNINVSRGSCQQPVPYGDIMKMDGLHGLVEASLILSVLKSWLCWRDDHKSCRLFLTNKTKVDFCAYGVAASDCLSQQTSRATNPLLMLQRISVSSVILDLL